MSILFFPFQFHFDGRMCCCVVVLIGLMNCQCSAMFSLIKCGLERMEFIIQNTFTSQKKVHIYNKYILTCTDLFKKIKIEYKITIFTNLRYLNATKLCEYVLVKHIRNINIQIDSVSILKTVNSVQAIRTTPYLVFLSEFEKSFHYETYCFFIRRNPITPAQ